MVTVQEHIYAHTGKDQDTLPENLLIKHNKNLEQGRKYPTFTVAGQALYITTFGAEYSVLSKVLSESNFTIVEPGLQQRLSDALSLSARNALNHQQQRTPYSTYDAQSKLLPTNVFNESTAVSSENGNKAAAKSTARTAKTKTAAVPNDTTGYTTVP